MVASKRAGELEGMQGADSLSSKYFSFLKIFEKCLSSIAVALIGKTLGTAYKKFYNSFL